MASRKRIYVDVDKKIPGWNGGGFEFKGGLFCARFNASTMP